ncbi:MAG: hypothetical protein K5905_17180 [Roseibium sp.]|uniref:hypothetical protein n=1 Tax=Roseibium sp. TaxID=1936156 RepID=UPI002636B957|nr:hypothetical protein [Roseibium sp.]MCV0427197.1 hypothetical protein [Roseibium sp.]
MAMVIPLRFLALHLALFLVVLASPVRAMTEEEQQRCVWSCLANFGPNTNPAYHECVKDNCLAGSNSTGETAATSKPSVAAVTSRWSAGTTFDGKAQYAGLGDADGTYGFYYLCDRQGRSEIMLVGLQGPAATMHVTVDGVDFPHTFEKGSGGHTTAIASDAPLITALSRGSAIEVRNPSGILVIRYGLRGSSKAIATAIASCR